MQNGTEIKCLFRISGGAITYQVWKFPSRLCHEGAFTNMCFMNEDLGIGAKGQYQIMKVHNGVEVPMLIVERIDDIPLHESMAHVAHPCDPKSM